MSGFKGFNVVGNGGGEYATDDKVTLVEEYDGTSQLTIVSTVDPINLSTTLAESKRLMSVEMNWVAGVAPTTAEDVLVTINRGASFSTISRKIDPGTLSKSDVFFDFEEGLILRPADQVTVTYTNTDQLAIGLIIMLLKRD